jgi:hypothetical protein
VKLHTTTSEYEVELATLAGVISASITWQYGKSWCVRFDCPPRHTDYRRLGCLLRDLGFKVLYQAGVWRTVGSPIKHSSPTHVLFCVELPPVLAMPTLGGLK